MNLLSLRRTSIAVAAAVAGVCGSAAPALASGIDGTSNTIQVAAAQHRVAPVGLMESDGIYPPFA
jgi:hypothetical protein